MSVAAHYLRVTFNDNCRDPGLSSLCFPNSQAFAHKNRYITNVFFNSADRISVLILHNVPKTGIDLVLCLFETSILTFTIHQEAQSNSTLPGAITKVLH